MNKTNNTYESDLGEKIQLTEEQQVYLILCNAKWFVYSHRDSLDNILSVLYKSTNLLKFKEKAQPGKYLYFDGVFVSPIVPLCIVLTTKNKEGRIVHEKPIDLHTYHIYPVDL